VADVRWYPTGSAREAFEAAHLPGAVFLDIDRDLAAPRSPGSGRHPLPTPEHFAATMERSGIGDGVPVVAYDDVGGAYAARLWWMLWILGEPVAVLDGGLASWPGPIETGPAAALPPPRRSFTPRPWPADRIAGIADVERLRREPGSLLLDARAPERYRGEVEPIDPKPGHIPGASNAPWADNLDPGTGRFRSREDLRARYAAVGAERAAELVVYCGSGVTACHDVLALELAGLPGTRLYAGSWSEWSADADRSVATGDEPG
jgi:thiosulfate/3-mercaptopyruvate sulfurtransferase